MGEPLDCVGLQPQEVVPLDIRQQAGALASRMDLIKRILTAQACTPDRRRQAKDELAALAKDAAALWSLI